MVDEVKMFNHFFIYTKNHPLFKAVILTYRDFLNKASFSLLRLRCACAALRFWKRTDNSIFNTSFSISPLKYQRSASGDMEMDVLNIEWSVLFQKRSASATQTEKWKTGLNVGIESKIHHFNNWLIESRTIVQHPTWTFQQYIHVIPLSSHPRHQENMAA